MKLGPAGPVSRITVGLDCRDAGASSPAAAGTIGPVKGEVRFGGPPPELGCVPWPAGAPSWPAGVGSLSAGGVNQAGSEAAGAGELGVSATAALVGRSGTCGCGSRDMRAISLGHCARPNTGPGRAALEESLAVASLASKPGEWLPRIGTPSNVEITLSSVGSDSRRASS